MLGQIGRIGAASLVSLSFALASLSPARAHAHLVSASPAANAVVTVAPTSLTLKFSEAVELKFTGAAITGPGNAAIGAGVGKLDPQDASTFILPMTATLSSGKYNVEWRALARDGHKTKGAYSFTIAP